MNKSEVCVKLTRKNCKKVLEILEMFGEPIYKGTKKSLRSGNWQNAGFEYIGKLSNWGGFAEVYTKTLIKPKELKQILAKEHLKEGDIIVARIDSSNGAIDYITSFNHFHETGFSGKNWVCLDSKTPKTNTGTGSFDKFLRFATNEEKSLLEPKTTTQTIVREVWVNHYYDGEYHIHTQFTESQHKRDFKKRGQTVKGTLTYDIPMTKV